MEEGWISAEDCVELARVNITSYGDDNSEEILLRASRLTAGDRETQKLNAVKNQKKEAMLSDWQEKIFCNVDFPR